MNHELFLKLVELARRFSLLFIVERACSFHFLHSQKSIRLYLWIQLLEYHPDKKLSGDSEQQQQQKMISKITIITVDVSFALLRFETKVSA